MTRALGLSCACALALAGCGDDPCPEGTTAMGERCVAPDDAGATDGGTPDGSAPEDAGPSDAGDACAPVAETCNGIDDDCDGRVDELYPSSLSERVVTTNFNGGAAMASFEAGYVAVWNDASDRLQWQVLGPTGTSLSGFAQRVTTATATQSNPSVGIVTTAAGPRAIVAWLQGGNLWVRSLALDGTTSPDPVRIPGGDNGNQRPAVVSLGDRVAVFYQASWVGRDQEIASQPIDGQTGMLLGSPVVAAVLQNSGTSLTFNVAAVRSEWPMRQILVGAADQRPGDLVVTGYLTRMAWDASLSVIGTPLRLQPAPDQSVSTVVPVAYESAPDRSPGFVLLGTDASRTWGVELDAAMDGTLSARGDFFVADDDAGLPLGGVGFAGTTWSVTSGLFPVAPATDVAQRLHVLPVPDSGDPLELVRLPNGASVGLARRDDGTGAALHARLSGATAELVFRQLGCE